MRPVSLRFLRLGVAAAAVAACAAILPQAGHAQYGSESANRGTVGIISGAVGGTYVQIANDLANVLDDGQLRVIAMIGKGSVQNVLDILYLKGVDLGIVQSDVMAYLQRDPRFSGISRRMNFITKLYNEEFHLLARTGIRSVEDLAGKAVNVDGRNSGTFMTASIVFEALNIPIKPTLHDQALALQKLRSGEIDAMVYVAGKPAALFRDLSPEDGVHLLPVPITPELLDNYFPSALTSADYPDLIGAGNTVETVAVGAIMAVFNWDPESHRYRKVARFVEAFLNRLDELQQPPRHPKWREVSLGAQVPGWTRFGPVEKWLRQNRARAQTAAETAQEPDPGLRREFERFLAADRRAGPLKELTPEQHEALFETFIQWQARAGRQ